MKESFLFQDEYRQAGTICRAKAGNSITGSNLASHERNPHFREQIQGDVNPSRLYHMEMRNLHIDGLKQSLYGLKSKQERQGEGVNREQLRHVQDALGELEKNNSRGEYQMKKSRNYQNYDELKNSKITEHVNYNLDKDVFNHENDRYHQYQKKQWDHAIAQVHLQQQIKQQIHHQHNLLKQQQYAERLRRENILKEELIIEKERKKNKILSYRHELAQLIDQKKIRQHTHENEDNTKIRHNPITNPIEYRVDNPYILRQLEIRRNPQ